MGSIALGLTVGAAMIAAAGPASANKGGDKQQARITETPLATVPAFLNRIATGSDENVWFTEGGSNKIGRMTDDGKVTEFTIPTADSNPIDIVAGPDGALWFTEFGTESGTGAARKISANVGRITTDGKISEFAIPANRHLFGMTVGPDKALWFIAGCCQSANNQIGRITTSGQVSLFPVAAGTTSAVGIVGGHDGGIWFTAERGFNRKDAVIERMSTAGKVTGVFPIPSPFADPSRLAVGADGNVWFTEQGAVGANGHAYPTNPQNGAIGRITPAGVITEFKTPTVGSNPAGITLGADGNLWFTEYAYKTDEPCPVTVTNPPALCQWGGNKIGRITTSGNITEFALPTPFARADGITAGPDEDIFFTETPKTPTPGPRGSGAIGRLRIHD